MPKARARLVAALTLALFPIAATAGEAWTLPRIVRVTGVEVCFNYSRMSMTWGTVPREDRPGAILVRDGDLLMVAETLVVPYRDADGATLAFDASEEGILRLGGRVVALALGEAPEPKNGDDEEGGKKKAEADEAFQKAWAWLAGASEANLAGVRAVLVEAAKPERMPLLRKLAKASPGAALVVAEDGAARRVLPLFQPRSLICSWGPLADPRALPDASLARVRFLAIGGNGKLKKKVSLAFLGRLPALERLFLPEWDPQKQAVLPETCQRLRGLVLAGDREDLLPIAHLTELRELRLFLGDMKDIGGLAGLGELDTLSILSAEGVEDLTVLGALRKLRWLGLPTATTQEQLVQTIREHPDLRVLEIVALKSLRPLAELKQLEALVLLGEDVDFAALKALKSLRLLLLPEKAFKEHAADVAALEAALPDCVVAQGGGICLGSGWVLALLPALGAAWLAARRRRAD